MFALPKIDMHVHCLPERDVPKLSGRYYVLPQELRQIYDANGIEKGVVMCFGASPECATDSLSMREARKLTNEPLHAVPRHPGRSQPGCRWMIPV